MLRLKSKNTRSENDTTEPLLSGTVTTWGAFTSWQHADNSVTSDPLSASDGFHFNWMSANR